MAASLLPELQSCVQAQDMPRLESLLKDIPNPSERALVLDAADKDGFRLIHRAGAMWSVAIMQALLRAGADPNAKDRSGDTPLHWACFSGNLDAVVTLLEAGGDPLLPSMDGKTPLDAAIEEKHSHILQILFSRPWNIYNTRAVLEPPILYRGVLRIKVQSRLVNNRRIWRYQHVVLSSMLRSLFIYRGKDISNAGDDSEHVIFQHLLAVRLVGYTRRRYVGRRFNVYVLLEDHAKLNFNFISSGLDDAHIGDYTVGADQQDDNNDNNNNNNNRKLRTESNSFPVDGVVEEEEAASGGEEEEANSDVTKKASFKNIFSSGFGSFRRPRRGSSVDGGDSSNRRSSSQTDLLGKKKPTFHSVCISFLAESPKDAKRWMDAFRQAGQQGKTMLCVKIQNCWRAHAARKALRKRREDQINGVVVAQRRGMTSERGGNFVPLDAQHTTPPPRKRSTAAGSGSSSTQLISTQKKGNLVTQLLKASTTSNRKKTNLPTNNNGTTEGSHHNRFMSSSSSRGGLHDSSSELAMPLEEVFHNAEDISGYLKKRSETGVSGALHLWKTRFAILSHMAGEVQYYDPKKKTPNVHRIPFSSLLSVFPVHSESTSSKDKLTYFTLRIVGAKSYRFEAIDQQDRDRWVLALTKVLPRKNVAALTIQRIFRGFRERSRVKQMRLIALQNAMRKRDEALTKIEEARQKAAGDLEQRQLQEELQLQEQNRQEEREYKRKIRDAKKKAAEEAELLKSLPLPTNWKEHQDKKSGKTYYHNRKTGETTWTRPKEDMIESTSSQTISTSNTTGSGKKKKKKKSTNATSGGSTENEGNQVKEISNNEDIKREEEEQLPSGWRAVLDSASGETYFYNSSTKESTWTRPTSTGTRKVWSKRYDPNSTQYYYYNEQTGVSQWDAPPDFQEGEEEEEEGTVEKESFQNREENEKNEQQEEEPQENEVYHVEQNNKELANAAKEAVANRKALHHKKKLAAGEEIDASSSSSMKRTQQDKFTPKQEEEPTSKKRSMKSNTKTGKRSSGSHQAILESPQTNSMKILEKALDQTNKRNTAPDAWKQYKDPKSGKLFYVNSKTGEKSWSKPAGLGGPKSIKDAWIALEDDKGREYYNNSISGESVWKLPTGHRLTVDVENQGEVTHSLEVVAAFTRHIDLLMSQFPKRRIFEGEEEEQQEEENEQELWNLLDEEDDPYHYSALHEKGGLFEACRTGLLFCRLINRVEPETIDPRAMNIEVDALAQQAGSEKEENRAIFLALENHAMAINAVRSLGGQLPKECTRELLVGANFMSRNTNNINVEDEEEENVPLRCKMILHIVWEILQLDLFEPISVGACRPLLNLLHDEETIHEFDGIHESEKLLRWIRFHAKRFHPRFESFQFGGNLSHNPIIFGSCLCACLWAQPLELLPSKEIPSVAQMVLNDPSQAGKLTEVEVETLFEDLTFACQAVGIRLYATRKENLRSKDRRLQLACAAVVFTEYHNLPENLLLNSKEQEELLALHREYDSNESRDERILRTWINSLNLKQRDDPDDTIHVTNLFKDIKSGVVMLHVLQNYTPDLDVFELFSCVLSPENKFQMLENANIILEIAQKELKLSIVNLGAFDIVDGNRKLLLGLLWQIMRYASIFMLESLNIGQTSEADILKWANERVRLSNLFNPNKTVSTQTGRQSSVRFVERPLVMTEVEFNTNANSSMESSTNDGDHDDGSKKVVVDEEEKNKKSSSFSSSKRGSLRSSLKRSSLNGDKGIKYLNSYKDPSIRDGYFLLALIDAVKPGIVNWKHAIPSALINVQSEEGLDLCERNAKYVVSLALKLNCSIFLSWEDILEVKSRALFIFIASLFANEAVILQQQQQQQVKRKRSQGGE